MCNKKQISDEELEKFCQEDDKDFEENWEKAAIIDFNKLEYENEDDD